MNKEIRKVKRSSAGVKIEYRKEKDKIEDICRGCPFDVFCYKYCKPEICKEIKEEIDGDFGKHTPHQSSSKETITIVKVLCGYGECADGRKGHFWYRYVKVKSIDDINGHHIISKHQVTEGEYLAYERLQKKKRPPINIYLNPPPNPWI